MIKKKTHSQSQKLLELYLIDGSVNMSCDAYGLIGWDHMLGCTKYGTLVLVVPCKDGIFVSSAFNTRGYAKWRKVKWLKIR